MESIDQEKKWSRWTRERRWKESAHSSRLLACGSSLSPTTQPSPDLCCKGNARVGAITLLWPLLALPAPATELIASVGHFSLTNPHRHHYGHIWGILYPVFVFLGKRNVHGCPDSCEWQNSASEGSLVCLLSVVSDFLDFSVRNLSIKAQTEMLNQFQS